MKQQPSATSETQVKDRMIIDFSGKLIYVGIDVHQKDYQVAKVRNGICLGNHRMSANSDVLIKHLHSHYPGAESKCVYESCAWGFNLQCRLTLIRYRIRLMRDINRSKNRIKSLLKYQGIEVLTRVYDPTSKLTCTQISLFRIKLFEIVKLTHF